MGTTATVTDRRIVRRPTDDRIWDFVWSPDQRYIAALVVARPVAFRDFPTVVFGHPVRQTNIAVEFYDADGRFLGATRYWHEPDAMSGWICWVK
jgi:hypothetical protein